MEKILLKQLEGCEPSCPKCGNSNAMLHHVENGVHFLKCRDCGHLVKESSLDPSQTCGVMTLILDGGEKIKEHHDIPIYVYLYEDVFEDAILWMVFYNGTCDAVELLTFWLEDAVDTYLDGLTVTVIEDDPLDGGD